MKEDQECNTCAYYDPVEGICKLSREGKHGYDGEDCEKWKDWESEW